MLFLYKDKLKRDKIEINASARILMLRELAVLSFSIFCKLDFIIFLTVALP
jgi:hypothetical protein